MRVNTILNIIQAFGALTLIYLDCIYIKLLKRKRDQIIQYDKNLQDTAALNDLLFQEYYKICEPKTEEEIAKEDEDEERI